MKNLFIVLALILSVSLYSQSWKFESGGNAFDGQFKTSYVMGKGADSPYVKPLLAINMFNEQSLNFYIASAGYFQNESSTDILWAFNNEPNVIYKTIDFSISKDNKTIFLNIFKDGDGNIYSQLDFIEKLKNASKVDVRIEDKYGKNDISFTLIGSTKAINYAISKEYLQNYELAKSLLEEEKAEKAANLRLGAIKVDSLLSKYDLTQKEKEKVFAQLGYQSTLSHFSLNDIDSLRIDVNKKNSNLFIYDNSGLELHNFKYFDHAISDYVSLKRSEFSSKEKEILKKEISRIRTMLINDGMSTQECSIIEYKLREDIVLPQSAELSDIESFTFELPSRFIKYSSLQFLDIQGESIFDLGNIDSLTPIYIKSKVADRNKEARTIINELLSTYQFSQDEFEIIQNYLNKVSLFNFEPEKMVKSEVSFNKYDKSNIVFNFMDKESRSVYKLLVYNKTLYKSLKRRF